MYGIIFTKGGDMMGKRVLFFYGINLLITLAFAMIFGGVLGSIKGNELILGMIVTMGVQLSLLATSLIYRKKYHEKRNYNYNFNKYIVLSIIIPVIVFLLSSFCLGLLNINYVPTEYINMIFVIAIITTIIGSVSEEIGWRGTLLPIFEKSILHLLVHYLLVYFGEHGISLK